MPGARLLLPLASGFRAHSDRDSSTSEEYATSAGAAATSAASSAASSDSRWDAPALLLVERMIQSARVADVSSNPPPSRAVCLIRSPGSMLSDFLLGCLCGDALSVPDCPVPWAWAAPSGC